MQVTTIGPDLAKNIFQVLGLMEDGKIAFDRALWRSQGLAFFEGKPPCRVGMEARSSSDYWVRELTKPGHDVRLIPAML